MAEGPEALHPAGLPGESPDSQAGPQGQAPGELWRLFEHQQVQQRSRRDRLAAAVFLTGESWSALPHGG